MSPNTKSNKKRNISCCLFGKADANAVYALEKEVIEEKKNNFVQRWGFDVDKFQNLTKVNQNLSCSAPSIGVMKEGDFIVVQSWF